uniref:Dipeptidyl peptidase 8 n=1 Tax=Caenorhabditis tropicalis TaxID=1561998 RepID=A0A1I7T867_9PELO
MREAERAKFDQLSFPDLLQHAKNWKTEARGMQAPVFSKLNAMKVNGELTLFAIAAPNGTSTQIVHSAVVPPDLLDLDEDSDMKEIKLKPANNADSLIKKSAPSAEFAMLCERQRTQIAQGITDFEICNGEMTLMAGEQLFRYNPTEESMTAVTVGSQITDSPGQNAVEPMDVSESSFGGPGAKGCSAEHTTSSGSTPPSGESPKPTPTPPKSSFISAAKICPSNPKLLAYVLNKQVYIERDGQLVYKTTPNSKFETNGVPSYIVQEELERFEGMWWSETEPRLLYEHVNEEKVVDAQFGINGENPSVPMKYPKAGTKNASSRLEMVILDNDQVHIARLSEDVLRKHCPDYEYITRAGFFSDGTSVWVQLMNRDQSTCYLLLIPLCEFDLPPALRASAPINEGLQLSDDLRMGVWDGNTEEPIEKPPRGKLLKSALIHKGRNEHWINTHNAIYPLKITDEEQPLYEFIYCLEKPHGSCLSIISAELDKNGHCRHTEEKTLMAETYSINKSMGIIVDEKRNLVYFTANESHPTEWNICVSNYRTGNHTQLTETGVCFRTERGNGRLAIDLDIGFACWMTSLGTPPHCRFYSFKWTRESDLPEAVYTANVFITPNNYRPELRAVPEMIEYTSKRTGLTHYGLIIRPENCDISKSYPVFHYVYGGPGVQIVHNDFSWVQFIRFSRLGYVVVIIDNRGSAHRGIDFEGHISRKMGTVEVEDQVEGLQFIAERSAGLMDMNRVVVHGWSYGGYMALQLLAKYPRVYCACIAGGAVSDWRLYDTAYTERYMGYPVVEDIYNASSITRLVGQFPDDPNRLMLVHGLMDENVHFTHLTALIEECVKKGKWHELVVFPHERHGIRSNDASIYLDARMMYFAQTAIHNRAHANNNKTDTSN